MFPPPRNPQSCGQEEFTRQTTGSLSNFQHTQDNSCPCGHDHSADIESMSLEELGTSDLFPSIDITSVRIFNGEESHSDPRSIFGPWNQRNTIPGFVRSDVDETLLFHIPFVDTVQLHSIYSNISFFSFSNVVSAPSSIATGGDALSCPKTLHIFKNTFLDFDEVENCRSDQTLSMNQEDQLPIPVNPRKFHGVNSLTIYIEDNYGNDLTKLDFFTLRGFSSKRLPNKAPVTTYELNGNFADHPEKLVTPKKQQFKQIE